MQQLLFFRWHSHAERGNVASDILVTERRSIPGGGSHAGRGNHANALIDLKMHAVCRGQTFMYP